MEGLSAVNQDWVVPVIIMIAVIAAWHYVPMAWGKVKGVRQSNRETKSIKKLLALNNANGLDVLGEKMRGRVQDRVIADGICDLLEDRHNLPSDHPLHLSSKQKREYMRKLGLIWPDLLLKPRGIRLKQKIQSRMTVSNPTPVNIPGPQPGEKASSTRRGKLTVVTRTGTNG